MHYSTKMHNIMWECKKMRRIARFLGRIKKSRKYGTHYTEDKRESWGIIFLWCMGLQVYCNYQASQYRNEKDNFLSGFSFMCTDFEVGLLCCNRGDINSVLHKMCFLFFVVCVFCFDDTKMGLSAALCQIIRAA